MLLNTLSKLESRIPQLKPDLATPMESETVNCNIEDIDNFNNQFEEILSIGITTPFVINVDETGCSECPDDNIKIPISRTSKRSSMIVGICADGTTIPPGIAIQRKTVELELYESGYTPNKILIDYQENGFFDTKCFINWCKKIVS